MLLSLLYLATAASAIHNPTRHSRHRDLAARAGADAAKSSSTSALIDPNATPGTFKVVGDSGVSAQMMFLGSKNTVYILDKAENNSLTITTNGETHPAWATSYNLLTNEVTPMDVWSNTFCAAGLPIANGSWVVFGGNQRVTYKGIAVNDTNNNPTGANPFLNTDGGEAIRLLNPCDDGQCQWVENTPDLKMTGKRWYPTIEGLADGSLIVIGGDKNGGYVATAEQNNPTYEYWPQKDSGAIHMQFLEDTLPTNLYPLTWLLSNGKLFMQAAYSTILYDMDTKQETKLQDMPYAQRVYPASAATAMLPLTPANNYAIELLFCGGSAANYTNTSDGGAKYNVTAVRADDSCVRIKPEDANPTYTDDDRLPEPRSMGSFIYLPDGTMWLGNGVGMGTAGYGDEGWSYGQSYGQEPVFMPVVYNPNAPAGSRFNRDGLSPSEHERMYHSSAILLADGSIMVSGSNPNADVVLDVYPTTSYVVEKWTPVWYNKPRPVPSGFPKQLSYGGEAWNLTFTDAKADPSTIKVVIVRTGFSTHGINFGQRYLELETSYSKNKETGEITVFASQMPPNPNLVTPGPAMIFLVVGGVPSEGEMIQIGSGKIEKQPTAAAATLPKPTTIVPAPSSSSKSSTSAQATTSNGVDTNNLASNATGSGSADKAGSTSSADALVSPALAVVLAIMCSVAWM